MSNRKEKQIEEFNSFEEFFDRIEERPGYWAEVAKLEFTREVLTRMEKSNVSKTELASRLEVQPGMVTRLLGGRNNFEIETMVRMALALNCRFRSHLEPVGAKTVWYDFFNTSGCSENQNKETWNPVIYRPVTISESEELNYAPVATAA